MPNDMIRNFFKLESSAGIILCLTAVLAIILENSIFQSAYGSFLTLHLSISVGEFSLDKPLLLWVNDGLMAIFFLLVGLEIKREVLEGQLSNRSQIILPAIAAFGGIIFPSLIYIFFNYDNSLSMRGWAIPAATDIAFALGILMLLGNRVSDNLKICLLAIAIMDDLAAIVIIAIFYTESLSLISIGLSLLAIIGLALLNIRGVTKLAPYLVLGFFLWVFVLKSGVHATLAGVVLAFFIPIKTKHETEKSPLRTLEHELHPWVAYGILPFFAFANAGISLSGLSIKMLMQPITLGIALGLFFGKQLGVMLMTILGRALKIVTLPTGVSWLQFYGMACLTGVGFTMSLFIGTLAFKDYDYQIAVRLGVIMGSISSGILGYSVLRFFSKKVVRER